LTDRTTGSFSQRRHHARRIKTSLTSAPEGVPQGA
jgi:hypothetical protein